MTKDKFKGIYLSRASFEDSLRAFFRETNEKDNFLFETILGEILSAEKVKFDKHWLFSYKQGWT